MVIALEPLEIDTSYTVFDLHTITLLNPFNKDKIDDQDRDLYIKNCNFVLCFSLVHKCHISVLRGTQDRVIDGRGKWWGNQDRL